jgi:hypothetical protein
MEDGKIYGSANRRKMYDNLSKDGFELGTFEDFNQNMDNKDTRQAIYRAAQGAGWELPEYDQFDRDMTVRQMKIGGEMKEVDHATYDDFMKRHPSGTNVKKGFVGQTPQQAPQQQPKPAVVSSAPKSVEAPESQTVGTPWGSEGSATGKSAAYKPSAPGQVRETGDPGASQFGVPYKPDTEMTAAERDAVYRQNDFAVKQLRQMEREEERRSQPVMDTGNKDVNSHIIKTQGEWEDDLQKGVKRISSSVVVPAVDKAVAEFDKKASEVFEGGRKDSNATGGLPTGTAAGAGIFGNIRESNQAKDPDKILNYLKQQMESVYKDSSFVEEIGKEADRMGIDRNEYLENIIKPQIQSDLASRFESAMISKELPKSGLEYVVNGLSNSIVGMVADTFLKTKSQRAYKNQAEAMTEEGRNPYYSPSTSASLSKIGVTFAADAPFFGVTGRVGGQVAKKFAERQIQNMIAKGLSEGAARSIVGTALENSVGARMKNYIMQHVISSGITMGGFNALSEGARQVRDDEFDPLKLAGSTAEGLATGAAFGLTGGVSQALSQPLSGFAKIGAKAAGFGAEAETMYATEELAKMIQGEEGFTNPFEGSVESLMKLGVMKLSSPGGLVKTIGEIAHPLRSNQAQRTGVNFTKDEEALIRDSAEGKSLLEALSGMHPDKAVSEVNGKKRLTPEGEEMRRKLADSYNAFMENPEYPATVKEKVAAVLGGVYKPGLETGADIVQGNDGSVTLKTRDKDGNCIREMKFDSFEDADQWRNEFKTQMERNDAVNMWNTASDDARQKIVDAVRDQISGEKEAAAMLERANGMKQGRMQRELEKLNKFKEEHEGRELTDEEARDYIQTVIRDGSDEVFREMYQTIHDNAYPKDEYNPKRNYEDGRKVDPIERHFAQVDAQLAEEHLSTFGNDFAREVIDADDYADEKMAELATRRGVTKEQIEAARDYYNATAKLRGVMDEALKNIDEQVEAANAVIRRNTHPDSGTLIEASYDNSDYYVTAGHIQVMPDGKVVSSDGTGVVILRDRNTGEIEVVNPQNLTVTAILDPRRLMEANNSMEGLRGQLMKQADDSIELNPETPETPQEMGETFTGSDGRLYMVAGEPDGTGNVVWLKIELNEEGNPVGEPQPLDIDEYRKAKSNEIDAAERPQTEEEAVVTDTTEPVVETPVVEPEKTSLEQELENRLNESNKNSGETTTPASKIPVDKNGRKQYEQATPEDTLADLVEKKGEEKAGQMVDLMVDNLARQIDELSKKDMSKVTDMNDIDAHDTEIADLQKKLDYWNGISQQIKAQKAKKVWENLVNPKEIRNFATDPESQAKWVDEHFDEIVDSYIRTHGNILDPDKLRDALTPIGYNGKNVPDFKRQGKRLTKAVYERMLQDAVKNGNRSITLLTGAGGAGKSKATESMDFSDRGMVYDSAFNNISSLDEAIDAAKKAGMTDIQVVAVYNDAPTSFGNTIERGLRTGRFLALDYFVREAFTENQGKIAELRKLHPDVDIVCIDNSGNKSTERPERGRVSADEAANWDYTVNDAKLNELLDIFENGINEGRFTEDQAASIGRGLRNVTRAVADITVDTVERISRIERSLRGQDDGDLRPGLSRGASGMGGHDVVSPADGEVQGSPEERPAEGKPGDAGQTTPATPAADGEVRTGDTAKPGSAGSDDGGPEPPAAGGASGGVRPGQDGSAAGGSGASGSGGTGMVSGTGNSSGGTETRSGTGSGSSGNNAGGAGSRNQEAEIAGAGPLNVDNKTGKLYQKRVEANIGRTFTFNKGDGGRAVLTIQRINHDGYTVITRQDYDAHGNAVGEPHEVRYHCTRIGEAIGKGTWKKQLDTDEKLRQIHKFDKFKVGDIPVIDVLTDGEKQQILEAYEQGDKEKVGNLTGEFRNNHKEDFILRGREIRNQKVDKALARNGRGERLRGVREQYKGFPEALAYLEEGSMQPQTIEEYVADALGDVPKPGNGSLAYTSYKQGGNEIVGLKDESGFGSRGFNGDTKGFNPWLAPKGQGRSLKQFAESIHEMLPEGLKEQFSDQDIRNVIHAVMTSAEKPTDIANYILRNRLAQAEAEARHTEEGWMDEPDYQKMIDDNSFSSRLQRSKQSVNTDPTDGQKEAGNYKKGHISFGGYDFTIENPEGSMRRGESNGKKWEHKMNNTYGYILGKYGKDGDHLDMFINDAQDLDNWNGTVYVVDQVDPKTGKFDEHKCLYGFDSLEEAKKAYLSNYEEGWQGLRRITGVTKEGFDQWIDSSKQKIKEFADHSIAKEHMVESDHPGFDSALKQLSTRGISINDPDLMKEYGLKDLTLSKSGDHVTLNKIVVENQGQGNGTRFMEDLARLADEKGWTLALTPSGGFGAKSIKRLKDFYKRFGFVDNKGSNPDFHTRESMIRRPKDYEAANTPEQQEKILRDAVVDYLRSKGIEVSDDWKLGQKILDDYNSRFSVGEDTEGDIKAQKSDQPNFFRTANGQAYGYTYQGKIYIDPRIAMSETPIHEYGHLWCEMKRKTAPDEWNAFKDIMLNDKLVQPIIDKVKADYPELAKEGREDDFVEEIITQFSGKRGSERLREIADEIAAENGGVFGKAEAVTAMQRLKNILNRFWEGVAKMMGWKYTNANQIADRIMADMLNGVNSRERMKKASDKIDEMRVYHGSASEFDRFDHGKIGSGEGQAVSGHGTYVTTSEGTARYYADVAQSRHRKVIQEMGYTVDGKVVKDPALARAYDYLKRADGNVDDAVKACEHTIEVLNRHKDKNPFAALRGNGKSVAEEAMDYLKKEQEKPGTIGFQEEIVEQPDRQLYEVEIPDDTGNNYFDLDKKLNQKQKAEIKKRFLDAIDKSEDADYWKRNRDIIDYDWKLVDSKDATAGAAVGVMEQFLPSEKVSEILSDMGYVGNKTKGSDGTTYVIYNDGDLDIKDRIKFQLVGKKGASEAPKFQRTGSPEPEMTPEERQYWNKWDAAMKKWKERNAMPAEATGPGEKPKFRQGESALDFAKRLVAHNREKALWQTAPKLEDYRQVRDIKDNVEAAREVEKRYPDSPSARMRRMAAELQQIRSAMSRQKAYDKATVKAVTDFAQDFMRQGFGDNLSRGEMERMLSSLKNATGAKDIRQSVDNIMNILIDNHLRNLDQQVQKLSSTKELSKTAQGVEKQGKLELKGQRMIQAFRKAREGRMDADKLREEISKVAEKMARNDEEAPMWEQEFEGLQIALQYQENIEASRDEYADLDREYKEAVSDYKTSGRSYKDQQELLESLDQAMMENKIERIGMFGDIIGRLQGNISESMQGAKEFVEREKERVKHIQQIANFDLAGKPADALREKTKGKPANFFLQPLGTFEQMLRQFGSRNANGEGYLYDYFMRNWMDATDKAFLNEQKAKEELDAKAREVFGSKVKRWSDLYDIARSLPSLEVEVLDGENAKTFKLTQGNLLYIYMADKMNDGRMKLRKMGIDEETVEKIRDFLDPRLVQLGDWLQGEYLPSKRTEYNKVHERMFGAPMAAIDNYFPLKVLGDARYQEQDVNVPDSETLPSTITGNIIKRRKNALPLDILHTDALSLAIEHVEDMERWAAQAEWNKDINTLLSYTTFRNKVKNMDTVYGSGDALWNAFKDTAKMAAGTYDSSAKSGHVDKAISNIAKGVTAAKINFRVYTAFKQLLSAPAFVHDVRIDDFVKNSVNPYGSWKWAMENMPVFQKRWKSRQVGDTRLMDDPTDWKMWKTNIVQMATRLGMSPNALVDGVTCAVGARSIYESRYRKYKKIGASDEVAHKRALQDAEIGYNLTQQSSEGAFTSAIQKDRTVAANMLSVFRNSSMSYTRQWYDAYRNLKKRTQKGYKEDSIKFMTRQIQEQFGLDEDQAKKAAELEYAREGRRDVARMLNMMFGVTVAWNLGASLPYLLLGDDDNTKKEMMTDALLKGLMAGPTEGFAAGNIWSDLIGRTAASEETRRTVRNEGWGAGIDAALKQGGDYEVNPLPLMADIQSMIKKLGYDKYAAAQDIFNIGMQSAVGVNPQTFTDMWNAAMDYAFPGWDGTRYTYDPDNMANAKETALFMMRVLNAPSSSWKNKYIDELGMNADDAKKLPYDEMARRYAHYKHWKDAPVMGWLRGEEGRAAKIEKMQQQFDKAVEERMQRLTDDELRHNVARSESPEEKRKYAKLISQRLGLDPGATSSKPNDKTWYQELYQERMDYEDIREDETLAQKLKDYREKDNRDQTRQEVKKRLDWIRDGKYDTDNGRKGKSKKKEYTLLYPGKRQLSDNDGKDAEDIMKNIRKWRKEALELLLRAEAESK